MLAVAENFPNEWYAQRDMHCMVSSACISCIARIAFIPCVGCTQSCMHACEACMHVYIACRHTVDGGNVASMTLLVCGRLQKKIIMLRLLGPPPPKTVQTASVVQFAWVRLHFFEKAGLSPQRCRKKKLRHLKHESADISKN